jgi:chromosome segregation ATPase
VSELLDRLEQQHEELANLRAQVHEYERRVAELGAELQSARMLVVEERARVAEFEGELARLKRRPAWLRRSRSRSPRTAE